MDVIDMGVCLQGECQTDDVSDWQEGRHCVHQRPDKSSDTAAEREGTRVKLESLESSGNLARFSSSILPYTASILCALIHIICFLINNKCIYIKKNLTQHGYGTVWNFAVGKKKMALYVIKWLSCSHSDNVAAGSPH